MYYKEEFVRCKNYLLRRRINLFYAISSNSYLALDWVGLFPKDRRWNAR
jgi:hypothetical protein